MHLLSVPPARGAYWLRAGFEVFKTQPLGFVALYILGWLINLVLMQLAGIVGIVAGLAMTPLMSLAFLIATQRGLHGGRVGPNALIDVFKGTADQRVRMAKLCGLYVLAVFVLALVTAICTADLLAPALVQIERGVPADQISWPADVIQGLLIRGSALVLLGFLPLMLAFWHAPALVHGGGERPLRALYGSLYSCWMNRGAFAVMLGLSLAAGTLVMGMLSVLGDVLGHPSWLPFISTPLTATLASVFYVAMWFSIADSFDWPKTAPTSRPSEDQAPPA